MGVIEKLADKASEIDWALSSASKFKQIWMFKKAIDALKIGKQRGLEKEDTITLMAGTIERKVRPAGKEKRKSIEDFCSTIYEIYERIWNNKIPSKTELKYWRDAFAFRYVEKSEEKYRKMIEKNRRKEVKNWVKKIL